VAAISYDSVDLLRAFSNRVGLGYPLLADHDYRVIDSFGLVNQSVERDSPAFGYALPGYYVIGTDGVVQAKFFNEANNDRTTSANILIRQFDAEADGFAPAGQGLA